MKTNSPNPVEGDVQALIAHIKEVLQEYDEHGGIGYGESVYRTALAALTAERCGSIIQAVNPKTGSVNIFYRSRGIESIDPEEVAEWEMQEVEHLYTTPPAQLLRPVEFPDIEENETAFKSGLNSLIDCLEDCGDAEQGLRLALRSISEKWHEVKS